MRGGWGLTRLLLPSTLLAVMCAQGCASLSAPREDIALTVMSFNIWEGGGGPGSRQFDNTLAVLRVADADVVGIQESDGHMSVLAQAAGYSYYDQPRQIMSRYPIIERLSRARRGGGVAILVPGAGRVAVYNVHLEAYPYGPYDLVRDGTVTVYGALANEYKIKVAEDDGNGHVPDVRAVLHHLQREAADTPVVWTGDFNVPSHLDWGEASRGFNGGFVVDWPVSRMLERHGFIDAYRAVHPDPTTRRGLTWTPIKPLDAEDEVHDRIDFVYARGNGVSVLDCVILGEPGPFTDIVFDRYPSDHRAVLATILLPRR